MPIFLGHAQCGNQDLIVKIFQRTFPQEGFGEFGGFIKIHGEHPLIKTRGGWEYGIVGEKDVQEPEPWNVSAQNNHAYREGSSQEKPYRSPEPGPEYRGEQDGQGGKSGGRTV